MRAAARLLPQLDALATAIPTARADAAPIPAGYYALAAIPARYALERGDWEGGGIARRAQVGVPLGRRRHRLRPRARRSPRPAGPARRATDVARLATLRDALLEKDAYWSEQVEIQRQAAEAWVLFAEGKRDDGLALMAKAADMEDNTDKSAVTPGPLAPARELLGEMLLEAERPADALLRVRGDDGERAEPVARHCRRGARRRARRCAREGARPTIGGCWRLPRTPIVRRARCSPRRRGISTRRSDRGRRDYIVRNGFSRRSRPIVVCSPCPG